MLSERFANVDAVNDLTFDIQARRVTGMLSFTDAGKSSTLRARVVGGGRTA